MIIITLVTATVNSYKQLLAVTQLTHYTEVSCTRALNW